jgi:hypothetical protein
MKYIKKLHNSISSVIMVSIPTLFLFLTLLFILPIQAIEAATYYLDQNHPNASDSNPGTESLPWKTLEYSATRIDAGDTLYIKNGTYYGKDQPEWYIPGINIDNKGTALQPIVIRNYPGHTPVIDGSNKVGFNKTFGKYAVSGDYYIVLDGLYFRDAVVYFSGDSSDSMGSQVTIQNSTFERAHQNSPGGSYYNDIELRAMEYVTIKNNYFKNQAVGAPGGGEPNQNTAVIVYHWVNDIVVENNEFYDFKWVLFQKSGVTDKSGYRNIFRYNFIHNGINGIASGYDGSTHGFEIKQNIFLDITNTDINLLLGNNDLKIANNVFYNSLKDIGKGIVLHGGDSPNTNVYNNIFYNHKYPIGLHYTSLTGFWIDYNDYYSYDYFDWDYGAETFTQWKTHPIIDDSHSITSDPKFVNAGGSEPTDYKLDSGSLAKGTGLGGVNMGAYITEVECMGLESKCTIDTTPPSAPSNLTVE